MLTELDPPQSAAANAVPNAPVVAIVGATGAVGAELLTCLAQRNFPLARLKLLASARSAGRQIGFREKTLEIEELTEYSFDDVDIALFSAGAGVSRRFAPIARRAGARVVDNSSAFRMEPSVPLVVPEVNADAMDDGAGVIANPNCVAAIAAVALAPLHRAFRIQRLNMATYQAASGAGAAAMDELRDSTLAHIQGTEFVPEVMPHPYAFNIFSHNADIDPVSGYNGEESKVMAEMRRILARPELPIGATCIRVPILRAHGIAISVEFDQVIDPQTARNLLAEGIGLKLVDDWAGNHFPMPSEATGREEVLVGRIRTDLGDPSGHTLAMFVVGDQLLKGAALNAVQIAETLLSKAS